MVAGFKHVHCESLRIIPSRFVILSVCHVQNASNQMYRQNDEVNGTSGLGFQLFHCVGLHYFDVPRVWSRSACEDVFFLRLVSSISEILVIDIWVCLKSGDPEISWSIVAFKWFESEVQ